MHIFRWLLSALVVVSSSAFVNVSRDLKAAFFVNLDRMPSRRLHMEKQLNFVGLHARRWSAVDWRRVARGEFDHDFVKRQGVSKSLLEKPAKEGNGTVGCFLSHVLALMQASKEVRPNELVLIMEDDVAIPVDWKPRIQKAVETAPKDWELLKLSGWGSARVTDRMNRTDPPNLLAARRTTTPRPPSLWEKVTKPFRSMFNESEDEHFDFFMMSEPFTEPARWNWGAMGWGTPNYFYAGTGAYLVRGAAIMKVIHHLRSRPINDLDAMLLSNGSMRFYEGWPHVFDLSSDAFHGPGLHGRKAFDEFNRSSGSSEITSEDLSQPETPTLAQPDNAPPAVEGNDVNLTVLGGGAAVVQRRHASAVQPPITERRSMIRTHNHLKVAKEASKVSADSRKQTVMEVGYAWHKDNLEYGHPAWLQNCAVIYLDVGSNIGVQIRKLFEPERYPNAGVLPLFSDTFGAPEDRKQPSTSSGLCALGLEPNPAHRQRLLSLEDNYTARGWNVHFYPYAAWKDEGSMMFDEAVQPETADGGAKLMSERPQNAAGRKFVSVRTINLADFVKSLPPHSVKLMKVDVEGAEYETIWRMLQSKVLCQGTIDTAFFEAHMWGDITDWQDDRSYDALVKHVKAGDCGLGGRPTSVQQLDDESYLLDEKDVEAQVIMEAQTRLKHKRIVYVAGITASLLVLFLGFHWKKADPLADKFSLSLASGQ